MTTLRHLERQWNARQFTKLLADLLEARPEADFVFEPHASQAALGAALSLIRLDELDQSHAPLANKLVRTLVAMQEADGGWGDLAVTALCLRALLGNAGSGAAIEQGLQYLANLQQPAGIWPAVPLRRMPADPATSAFILSQLAREPRFCAAVRLDDAEAWFAQHRSSLAPQTLRMWDRARARCFIAARGRERVMLS